MDIVLVTGGARSGKSGFALRYAESISTEQLTLVATATASDEEMRARIERHRAERGPRWSTREAPLDVTGALLESESEVVVLDCFTMLAANVVGHRRQENGDGVGRHVAEAADAIVSAARRRDGVLIVVTNEVGSSIHPPTPLGRWFADALGRANQRIARESRDVLLLVCGLPLSLKSTASGQ